MPTQIDVKQLKKLAAACRKAGIKHYKGDGIEFTLSDDFQEPAPKALKKTVEAPKAPQQPSNGPFEGDEPTNEELLFWSTQTQNSEDTPAA